MMVALLFGSCTTIQKTSSTSAVDSYVLQYPTVADLEVSPTKVSRTVSWSPIFSLLSTDARKTNTVAELLSDADADVLVEPQYIHNKSFILENTLTVSGFPAKFKNFRKATEADLKALNAGCCNLQIVSELPCHKAQPKCKKSKK